MLSYGPLLFLICKYGRVRIERVVKIVSELTRKRNSSLLDFNLILESRILHRRFFNHYKITRHKISCSKILIHMYVAESDKLNSYGMLNLRKIFGKNHTRWEINADLINVMYEWSKEIIGEKILSTSYWLKFILNVA